jgi:prephenate dehydrogenase
MAKSRITIVGLGLVGGSIGLALKRAKIETEVVGHDRDSGVAGRAHKRGAVDKTDWNLIGACAGAGLVVLALPLDQIKPTLEALQPYLEPGVIVTDTATTKVPVMQWAQALPPNVHFVGGDPIPSPRGSIRGHGIDAADVDLLKDATYCLISSATAASTAIQTLTNFVAVLGARPYFIDAAEHDGLMAGVEHLPALLETALAAVTLRSPGWRELGQVAGANYREATALLPQKAETGRVELLANRDYLLQWLDRTVQVLHDLRGMLEARTAMDWSSSSRV